MALSKKESSRFLQHVTAIRDDRVRYFYMMLGEAIALQSQPAMPVQANTGPTHLADLSARLNTG